MRAIWNTISSIASSELAFSGGGRTRTLTVVRRANAKSMRLTVDPRDATVQLILAPRTSLRHAMGWAADKREWIENELRRLPPPNPIVPGMTFLLDDADVRLDWVESFPRKVEHVAGSLRVGGPRDQLSGRVLRYLRVYAADVLTQETHELAASHHISVARISVGDPRTRWGSCSTSGDIRYSWRLILAPRFVRQSTVAHEVAHRIHMNHGPAFHALAAELTEGDPASARRWLRAHGPTLHWFGREG